MDIIKYVGPPDNIFREAEIVNNLKSKLWIERYRESGEFTFTAEMGSDAHKKLSIGSYVANLDSYELMMVEDHEVVDDVDKNAEVKITGRSILSFLENRIVGSNTPYSFDGSYPFPLQPYVLEAEDSASQIRKLLTAHLYASELANDANAIPEFYVAQITGGYGDIVPRTIEPGDLYTRLMELLAVDDLGLSVWRPGVNSAIVYDKITLAITSGGDLSGGYFYASEPVIFSTETGEIEQGEYLSSNRKLKNFAIVSGKWIQMHTSFFGATPVEGLNRRIMLIDGKDIDEKFDAIPTGGDLAIVHYRMAQRAQKALLEQQNVVISKIDLSKDAKNVTYRKDFNVGDIVRVRTHFTDDLKMRIKEYVEVDDENGISGYPTLSAYKPSANMWTP